MPPFGSPMVTLQNGLNRSTTPGSLMRAPMLVAPPSTRSWPDDGADLVDGVDAVLERHDAGVGADDGLDRLGGLGGVVGLDGEEDEVELAAGLGGHADGVDGLEEGGLAAIDQGEAVLLHRFEVGASGGEDDVMAGLWRGCRRSSRRRHRSPSPGHASLPPVHAGGGRRWSCSSSRWGSRAPVEDRGCRQPGSNAEPCGPGLAEYGSARGAAPARRAAVRESQGVVRRVGRRRARPTAAGTRTPLGASA